MTFEQKLPSAFRLFDYQWVCAEGSFLSAFSLVSSYFHHTIHIPLHRMHSFCTDERQCLAELVGVHASHHLGETLQEDGVDVGRGVQLVCLAFLRQTEALEEYIVHRWLDVVRLVVLHQFLFFFAGEPIMLAIGKLRFQLGEELLVLQGRVLYLLLYLDAEIASASRRVVQQVATVGGADERGHTG